MFCRTDYRFWPALLRTAPASAYGICVKTLPVGRRKVRGHAAIRRWGDEARGMNSGKPHNISPYPISHTPYPIPHSAYSIPYTPYTIPHTPYPIPHTPYPISHTLYPIANTPIQPTAGISIIQPTAGMSIIQPTAGIPIIIQPKAVFCSRRVADWIVVLAQRSKT